jgi:hypothetical protein
MREVRKRKFRVPRFVSYNGLFQHRLQYPNRNYHTQHRSKRENVLPPSPRQKPAPARHPLQPGDDRLRPADQHFSIIIPKISLCLLASSIISPAHGANDILSIEFHVWSVRLLRSRRHHQKWCNMCWVGELSRNRPDVEEDRTSGFKGLNA